MVGRLNENPAFVDGAALLGCVGGAPNENAVAGAGVDEG